MIQIKPGSASRAESTARVLTVTHSTRAILWWLANSKPFHKSPPVNCLYRQRLQNMAHNAINVVWNDPITGVIFKSFYMARMAPVYHSFGWPLSSEATIHQKQYCSQLSQTIWALELWAMELNFSVTWICVSLPWYTISSGCSQSNYTYTRFNDFGFQEAICCSQHVQQRNGFDISSQLIRQGISAKSCLIQIPWLPKLIRYIF